MHESAARFTGLERLLKEQRAAWREDRPRQVEDYLAEHPQLAADADALLDVIYSEFCLRQELGRAPQTDEYCRRFPQYAAKLPPLFSFGRAMRAPPVEDGSPPSETDAYETVADGTPQRVDRYRLVRLLGAGAFGRVWLAFDEELRRQVAVKVPTPERLQAAEDAETYLAEARTVAGLDHAHIVPIYDVGRAEDGSVYVVSKFIEGSNLAEMIRQDRPPHAVSAAVMASVAQALDHAHQKRLIHRDVKPANILIEDQTGTAYVADFGLAISQQEYLRDGRMAGTPAYMSPEQARGEGHRLDGRSDVFSTGVVLYELLTGKRPFRGDTTNEMLHQVVAVDPPPPRELDGEIPAELERICLKALSKRASDRYATAAEFADDLLSWHQRAQQPAHDLPIVPKGLRSFDAHDADFFLDLLPGPRNREGLPESVQFWKSRLEDADPDRTFGVGLIFGPSGCGKSSLVKAGLLPRLSPAVIAVYVEATPEETELRILRGLRKRVPGLPGDLGLVAAFAALRRRENSQVVVILDQFEQWLHAHKGEQNTELVDALRQCDGGRLQAVVMVRDDFSTATSRFLRELDVRIVEGHNFATVDLFDRDHAEKVLAKFGQAFGKLPERAGDRSREQQAFLSAAVDGLARDGRVVPVRLALFAEMVKDKPWAPATLEQVGGAAGIGVNFLEETFGARTANPQHRSHEQAARAVLDDLLPEVGTDIKGRMRSHAELAAAAGYPGRSADFNELLRILDGELRLITPTDPEGFQSDSNRDLDAKYYQLTHDYLVPSLREWLTRKRRETRRGRAELRLVERAALWSAKPESRQLPSLWEFLNVRLLTHRKQWTEPQKRMMAQAARRHWTHWGTALAVVLALALAGRSYVSAHRGDLAARDRENDRRRAELLVDALMAAPADAVPYAVRNLEGLREHAVEIMQRRFEDPATEPAHRLRAAAALAEYGDVRREFLIGAIAEAPSGECANLAAALGPVRDEALDSLRTRVAAEDRRQAWRQKARLAIVAGLLGDVANAQDMLALRPDPIQRTAFIEALPSWHADVGRTMQSAAAADDPALRSGICLGLGAIPAEGLPLEQGKAAGLLLLDWYQNRPDAATHGAAGWALGRWKIPLPETFSSDGGAASREWHVNSIGQTMIRIPAGKFTRKTSTPAPGDTSKMVEQDQGVTLTRPFWLGDREVSSGLFQRFIDDKNYPHEDKPQAWTGPDPRRSPTTEHPVQGVGWIDAVLFCNWLSRQEGRTPCYRLVDSQWELTATADGYRLPRESEWEYACRAGTETRFATGDAPAPLGGYAVVQANRTEPCGGKMPNGWGLFDAHGNVYEWCHDRYADTYGAEKIVVDPTGPGEGGQRVLRGGAFDYEARYAASAVRGKNDPAYRSYTVGFRIARPIP